MNPNKNIYISIDFERSKKQVYYKNKDFKAFYTKNKKNYNVKDTGILEKRLIDYPCFMLGNSKIEGE